MKQSNRKSYVSSHYLTMPDDTRIAVDVWLPDHPQRNGSRYPIILRQTRYFRSVQLRRPFGWLMGGRPFDHTGLYAKRRKCFLQNGYGWVDVDARGSGASSGFRTAPWSQLEVADALEIVRWIGQQRWCDGHVGSLGISYDGTAAEWLLCHPQSAAEEFPVFAIAPRFSSCDAFADIGFPGGLKNIGFSSRWHRTNHALDQNRLSDLVGWPVKLITSGVSPVDNDPRGQQRDLAVADHVENYSVLQRMSRIEFADDEAVDEREVVEPRFAEDGTQLLGSQLISPLHYARQITASRAAVFNYSGWWDGGYAKVAALRFLRSPNPGSRLILGPWNHGGGWNIDARGDGMDGVRESYDHDATLVEFFDHCRTTTINTSTVGAAAALGMDNAEFQENRSSKNEALPVNFYTMGEYEGPRWKQAATWPPPGVVDCTFLLTGEQSLELLDDDDSVKSTPPFQFEYRRVPTTTGVTNRWQTQAQPDARVTYPDRQRDAHLRMNFRSAPLQTATTVTGHPVITLSLACDASDAALFVYLEEVTRTGAIRMVTEGLLSLRHRKVKVQTEQRSAIADACSRCGIPHRTFCREDALPMPVVSENQPKPTDFQVIELDLLPVSYRFGIGSCYQVSIAMSDEGNFELATLESKKAATKMWLKHDHGQSMELRLPVERGVSRT